jgi:hypothetical protein
MSSYIDLTEGLLGPVQIPERLFVTALLEQGEAGIVKLFGHAPFQ